MNQNKNNNCTAIKLWKICCLISFDSCVYVRVPPSPVLSSIMLPAPASPVPNHPRCSSCLFNVPLSSASLRFLLVCGLWSSQPFMFGSRSPPCSGFLYVLLPHQPLFVVNNKNCLFYLQVFPMAVCPWVQHYCLWLWHIHKCLRLQELWGTPFWYNIYFSYMWFYLQLIFY